MPYLADLGTMLTAGRCAEREGITYVVEPFELGPVMLPTGEIMAGDPLVAHATSRPQAGYETAKVRTGRTTPVRSRVSLTDKIRAEIDRCLAPVGPSSAVGVAFSYLDQSALVREDDDLCPVAEVELGEDVRYV
jgi:hypothetical protein